MLDTKVMNRAIGDDCTLEKIDKIRGQYGPLIQSLGRRFADEQNAKKREKERKEEEAREKAREQELEREQAAQAEAERRSMQGGKSAGSPSVATPAAPAGQTNSKPNPYDQPAATQPKKVTEAPPRTAPTKEASPVAPESGSTPYRKIRKR